MTRAKKISSDDQLDLVFHALADRTRRAQLSQLMKGTARVSDLAEPFDMSLPAASKHLRVLESAGLISRKVDGRVHHCALRAEPLKNIEQWLGQYRPHYEPGDDG